MTTNSNQFKQLDRASDMVAELKAVFSDSQIESNIRDINHRDYEDAYSVKEIRDLLEIINTDILAYWGPHEAGIDNKSYTLVYEDRKLIILADQTGRFWNEQFRAVDLYDTDDYELLKGIVLGLHLEVAREHCDYSWDAFDPVVIAKPKIFRVGEGHALMEIARRSKKYGSVDQAIDTFATEMYGIRKSQWARLTARDQSTVTQNRDD